MCFFKSSNVCGRDFITSFLSDECVGEEESTSDAEVRWRGVWDQRVDGSAAQGSCQTSFST